MMVKFPSAARVEEAKCYLAFFLKGTNALVSIKRWSSEAIAKGKLHSVWIRTGGVPDELRHYFGLCEVGSMVGVVIEVDMQIFRKQDIVRIKVGVKDVSLIPEVAEMTVDLMLFDIFFEVEQVVEVGGLFGAYLKRGSGPSDDQRGRDQDPKKQKQPEGEQDKASDQNLMATLQTNLQGDPWVNLLWMEVQWQVCRGLSLWLLIGSFSWRLIGR
ncbi:hypothetical protein BRADI_1g59610v3 [Brachypodium distachyon]|uniref:Uncharacterized protein n=1 Tax=Brachypodium distachyon TaxID=15368 RepID=A0A0Q3HEQ0_BRADI|nr:hypothetical protein BRADI_1g59610v3 [Brachypodium distachyon]